MNGGGKAGSRGDYRLTCLILAFSIWLFNKNDVLCINVCVGVHPHEPALHCMLGCQRMACGSRFSSCHHAGPRDGTEVRGLVASAFTS